MFSCVMESLKRGFGLEKCGCAVVSTCLALSWGKKMAEANSPQKLKIMVAC